MGGRLSDIDAPAIRRMWRAQLDDPATSTVVALCDEIERLTIALDRAERGVDYWQRCATETDTKTYRALVERTAERDRLRAEVVWLRQNVAGAVGQRDAARRLAEHIARRAIS